MNSLVEFSWGQDGSERGTAGHTLAGLATDGLAIGTGGVLAFIAFNQKFED